MAERRQGEFQPCLLLTFGFALWRLISAFEYSGILFWINMVVWGAFVFALGMTLLLKRLTKLCASLAAFIAVLSFVSAIMIGAGACQECPNKWFAVFLDALVGLVFTAVSVRLFRLARAISKRSKELLA